MSRAICDQNSFYPFRALVEGHITGPSTLADAERFARTVVLHDEIEMRLEPFGDSGADEEIDEEAEAAGVRNVIVAFGPVLDGYDFFDPSSASADKARPISLSPKVLAVARTFSNADEGNVYYNAHVEYLQHVLAVVREGGSALLAGEFGNAAIGASSEFPTELFDPLDQQWQQFARDADSGGLGLVVPPVVSILLSRAARRDAIPGILADLRNEWGVARAKVWALVAQLKAARTLEDAFEIKRQLEEAARLIVPTSPSVGTRPIRVLWDIVAGGAAGAITAAISGGTPTIGAAVGAVSIASKSVPPLARELGAALFGHGAFDLARRVRRETLLVEPGVLARLLTDAEKRALGP